MVNYRLANGIELLVFPTTKFTTVNLKAYFVRPLATETVTKGALLPMILRRGTAHHPTQQQLWGAEIEGDVSKLGDYHVTDLALETVDSRYLPEDEDTLKDGFNLLAEIITQPAQEDGGFVASYLDEEKEILRSTLEGLINDRPSYAVERCLQTIFAGQPTALYRYGDLEDLDGINPQNLMEFHRQWLSDSNLLVAVCGNVDPDWVHEMAAEALHWQRSPSKLQPLLPKETASKVKRVTERLPGEQSQLVVGISSGLRHDDPLTAALIVFNGLFGGFGHSRLFRYMREEANLAYSAGSRLDRGKGLILAKAGIDERNADQALEIIEKQLSELRAGKISDDEMRTTITTILNNYRQMDDDAHVVMDYHVISRLIGRTATPEQMMEAVSAVTKEQVQEVAQRLTLDTVYLLATEGDEHE